MYDTHYPAPAAVLAAPEPLTITFPGTQRLDCTGEVNLTLAFAPLPKAPDFFLVLFVNTPAADAITPFSEPGFAGSVAFFIHPERQQHRPVFQLPIGELIRNTGREDAVTMTLVPLPYMERAITPMSIELTSCLDIAASASTADVVYR